MPALVAALVWLPAALRRRARPSRGAPPPGLWRNRLAWNVSLFMGVQSMAFYAGLSWLPTMLEDDGFSEGEAGALQALGALVQLVPAFAVPVLAARRRNQIGLLLVIVAAPAGGRDRAAPRARASRCCGSSSSASARAARSGSG